MLKYSVMLNSFQQDRFNTGACPRVYLPPRLLKQAPLHRRGTVPLLWRHWLLNTCIELLSVKKQ
ncbi:MAG: hypothetical protein FWG85_07320 [Bacteroidetes bacterium]|nr:hypothetical protein [Bacteroidota bacterium]